jgi:hypothetical protein
VITGLTIDLLRLGFLTAVKMSGLMIEAVCSSEKMVSTYKSTRRYNLEGQHRQVAQIVETGFHLPLPSNECLDAPLISSCLDAPWISSYLGAPLISSCLDAPLFLVVWMRH